MGSQSLSTAACVAVPEVLRFHHGVMPSRNLSRLYVRTFPKNICNDIMAHHQGLKDLPILLSSPRDAIVHGTFELRYGYGVIVLCNFNYHSCDYQVHFAVDRAVTGTIPE